MLRRATADLGFCGIKVHRHDARISREICEAARRLRLPVLYDVMGEVAAAELLADEYPDVDFIIPHLGSFADDWSAQLAFIDLLAERPNIYADTSGVRRFDLLRAGGPSGPGRTRCCSAPTARGCTRASSWRRSSCCTCRRGPGRWSSPATSCA